MIIAHLDMDAFFAAVEERENPQYAGLGIVVGADPVNGTGRGVVSTANYQARKYGIHSAMPISTAWRLSQSGQKRGEPETVFLPVNMSFYQIVSERIMNIIHRYVHIVEQTSIDEAYLDLSLLPTGPASRVSQALGSKSLVDTRSRPVNLDLGVPRSSHPLDDNYSINRSYQKAVELIKKIKSEIFEKEKLTAKVGIGPNKLIAKIASAKLSPDGLMVIKPVEVENFLDPLPIGDIPGIGPKTEEFFHKKNIFKVLDLKKISKEQLADWMGLPATLRVARRAGKHGEDIWEKVRGIDDSQVTVEREIKSISEQETFQQDTLSGAFILDHLSKLATQVIGRMKDDGITAYKTVTIVVRFADFTTKNKTHTLKGYTDSLPILKNETIKLILPFLDRRENSKLKLVRLIGVGIENFKGEKEEIILDKDEKSSGQTKLFNL